MAENALLAWPCLESCRFQGLLSFCPRGSHSLAKMPRVSRKESRTLSQRQRASLAKMTCGFGKGESAVYPQNRKSPCGGRGARLARHADARGNRVVRPSPSGMTGLALGRRRAGPAEGARAWLVMGQWAEPVRGRRARPIRAEGLGQAWVAGLG